MAKVIDPEPLKPELLGMQRGEGEGGQMIESNDSSPHLIMIEPAPIRARRRVASLLWNERFVIQPFRRGHGMILISEIQAK
jgi:hypothetical protein